MRRVRDLGMKQHPVESAVRGGHGGHRCVGASAQDGKPGWRSRHEVAVAGPHLQLGRHAGEQAAVDVDRDGRVSKFTLWRARDATSQSIGHRLHAVADPEHRDAARKDRWVTTGRAGIGQACWTARQDETRCLLRADGVDRDAERENL